MPLRIDERRELLELARRSIADGCGRDAPPPAPRQSWSAALGELRATFVTLKRKGQLRGCCGTIEPRFTLAEDVWRNAWASAYADPRFRPVPGAQIGLLELTVSVLTPLEPLAIGSEAELLAVLRPGLDGLVLRCGPVAATFLPAVWEIFPRPREFIAQLKSKAGWAPTFWSQSLTAHRYSTETFHSAAAPGAVSGR